jgi:hypothetical protein
MRAPCQNGALDTHDPKASHLRLSFLKKRSKITEIVAAEVHCQLMPSFHHSLCSWAPR